MRESMQALVLSAAGLFTIVTGFIVYFVVLYRNRQLKYQQEQEQQQAAFRHELLRAQIEVHEQTLVYISQEIHDNITQVLSFIKLSLAMPNTITEEKKQSKINESRELLSEVINDLRDLSKSLSFEHIKNLGLLKTVESESARINKSGLIKVNVSTTGDTYRLDDQRELVLFRIFQEALNNTLKHSEAKHLNISLQYQPDLFTLMLEDDGNGFSMKLPGTNYGSGLKNMENRATLIGAAATIDSSPGNGCRIKVSLNPFEQRLYTDGYHPDRFSR
jgi:signal transduction histidine kinase